MDEKTADLRDLFVETTGTDTVTEEQTEGPGTLVDRVADDDAVRSVVARMRERFAFTSDADDETLAAVARAVHEGADDAAVAETTGLDEAAVVDARMDLHLVREDERDPPGDADAAALRRYAGEEASLARVATDFGLDPAAVARPYRAAAADVASRRVGDRFRIAFADMLTDADLSRRHVDHEDGLDEAAADIETNVSF